MNEKLLYATETLTEVLNVSGRGTSLAKARKLMNQVRDTLNSMHPVQKSFVDKINNPQERPTSSFVSMYKQNATYIPRRCNLRDPFAGAGIICTRGINFYGRRSHRPPDLLRKRKDQVARLPNMSSTENSRQCSASLARRYRGPSAYQMSRRWLLKRPLVQRVWL